MKTAYRHRLGDVMVPFDSLDIGEVVKVAYTDTGDYDTLLVTKDNGCSECPYLSASHHICTAKWLHGTLDVPLCITRNISERLSFRSLDTIMEEL